MSSNSLLSTNSIQRGQASLDDIIFTLAVNFLMYVTLIIVFYMLIRFYLEEETMFSNLKEFMTQEGYTLVSTEDDLEIDLPSNVIEETDDNDSNDNISNSNKTNTNTTNDNVKSSNGMSKLEIESTSKQSIETYDTILSPAHKYLTSIINPLDLEERDKSNYEQISKVISCTIGLNVIFGIWGLLQERILTQTYDGDFFEYSYGLVFINRLLGLILSAYLMYYFKVAWVQSPLWEYSIPSVANMLSSWCQYEALKYVSFPTQMLAKAFKMVPVMLVGKFIHNKHYEAYEYISAGCVGFGIYLFIESSERISFQQNVFGDPASVNGALCGVVLLLLFLCFDSFTGQWQTRMFQIHHTMSPLQMMLTSNAFSAIFSFVTLIHQEELYLCLGFVYNHPEIYLHLILFCICSTFGQLLIYYTLKNFGAVVFSIIMAVRILLSTLLSCFIYSHPITELSFIGFLIVFGSIAYRIQRKMEGKPLLKWKVEDEITKLNIHEWREHTDV